MAITRRIEEIARHFRTRASDLGVNSPLAHLSTEIGMVSERLDRLRDLHRQHSKTLRTAKSAIRTDLKSLDSYEPRVFTIRGPLRQKLQKRALEIDHERRQSARSLDSDVFDLQDRLFVLLRQRLSLEGA